MKKKLRKIPMIFDQKYWTRSKQFEYGQIFFELADEIGMKVKFWQFFTPPH